MPAAAARCCRGCSRGAAPRRRAGREGCGGPGAACRGAGRCGAAPAAHPPGPPAGHGAHTYTYFIYVIDTHTHTHTRWMKLSSLQEDAGTLSSPDTRGKLALGSVFSSTRPLKKIGKSEPSHPFGAGAAHRSGSSLSSPQPLSSRIAPSPRRTAPFWVRGFLWGAVGSARPAQPRRAAQERREPPHTPLSWSASAASPHKSPFLGESRPPRPQTAEVWPVQIRSRRGGDGAGGGFPPTLVVAFSPRVCATFQAPAPAGLEQQSSAEHLLTRAALLAGNI